MPSALAFIGGGLLQGIGKGLVEDGKAKRERVLADLEHKRTLERDEKQLEGRRGLLTQQLTSDRDLAAQREAGATGRLGLNIGSQEKLASEATASREEIAAAGTKSRELIALENRLSREGISAAEIEYRKSEGALTRDLSARQLSQRLKSTADLSQQTIDAAQNRLTAGFGHSETLSQQTIDAAQNRLDAQLKSTDTRAAEQRNLTRSEGEANRGAARGLLDRRLEAPVVVGPGAVLVSPISGERIGEGKPTTPADTTPAEDRIIARHVQTDENGFETIDHEGAATELEGRGFNKAAQAQRRKGKAIVDQDIRREAEAQADAEVDEKSSAFRTDAADFKEDGGSRTRFRARRVREIIAERSGKAAPTTRPAGGNPGQQARRGNDGQWYIPDPDRPGFYMRVAPPAGEQAQPAVNPALPQRRPAVNPQRRPGLGQAQIN